MNSPNISDAISVKRLERAQAEGNMPVRFRNRTFETFAAVTPDQKHALDTCRATLLAIVHEPKSGSSLVMCGSPGTGKTHLACAIANALLAYGRTVKFGTVLAAIRHVKDSYRKDAMYSEKEAYEDMLAPDLLILDEIGVQVGSEHEKMILFEIINDRYQQCLSTILISNLNRTELNAYLGERVMDRFNETGAVIAFNWRSHRGDRAAAT
jgi:DNA replication protein DnaC